jgi:hypothetical protein
MSAFDSPFWPLLIDGQHSVTLFLIVRYFTAVLSNVASQHPLGEYRKLTSQRGPIPVTKQVRWTKDLGHEYFITTE